MSYPRCLHSAALVFSLLTFSTLVPVVAQEQPGTYYTIPGIDPFCLKFWLPSGIPVLRGLMFFDSDGDSVGREKSIRMVAVHFGIVLYSSDPGRFHSGLTRPAPSRVKTATAEIAQRSGHPELPNLPSIWDGQFDGSEITREYGDGVIALRAWSGSVPANVPTIRVPEETSYGQAPSFSGAQGKSTTVSVQWGWGHGYYSMRDIIWPWFEQVILMRVPANWDPRQGKPALIDISTNDAWLGDPATWFGEWPEIAPFSTYTKSKAAAVWLPNKDAAFVWRAYSSRHPTQTQQQQGEGHVGGAASTYGLSGQPNIMIVQPSRPYHCCKVGGKNYPLVRKDTIVNVATTQSGYRNVRTVAFYDGSRKMAEVKGNVYNIYTAKCTLSTPGVRSLIAILEYEKSPGVIEKVTSRPATIYVEGSIWGGSSTPSLPISRVVEKRSTGSRRIFIGISQAPRGESRVCDIRGRILASSRRGVGVRILAK